MAERIDWFEGRRETLSNLAAVPVTLYSHLESREVTYATGVHAYQASKTLNPAERARIASASSPFDAAKRGRAARLRPGWKEAVRYQAMRAVVEAKFRPSSPVAGDLLATGEKSLVEENRWHDNHWGDCVCGGQSCLPPGQNWLGRILAERREKLRVPQIKPFFFDA